MSHPCPVYVRATPPTPAEDTRAPDHTRRRGHWWNRARVAAAALISGTALTGCGPSVAMPDVVGMRLDVAHHLLSELGVAEFADTDVVALDDRRPQRDTTWLVVEQTPAAGTAGVGTGTPVTLSVVSAATRHLPARTPPTVPGDGGRQDP